MSLDTRSFEQKMYRAGSDRRPPQGADPQLPRPAKALAVFESPLVYGAGGKHWPVSSSTVPQAPENVFPGHWLGVPVDRVASWPSSSSDSLEETGESRGWQLRSATRRPSLHTLFSAVIVCVFGDADAKFNSFFHRARVAGDNSPAAIY